MRILINKIVAIINARPSSFRNTYESEVQKRLHVTPNARVAASSNEDGYGKLSIVTERDIEHLPQPMQKYLRYVGVIGKPKVHNFRAVFEGDFSRDNGKSWLKVRSQQYNFYDDRARFYYIESELFGVPFDGLHIYAGNDATMQIKVAGIFKVADAKGPEMTKGETVTMLNDMCMLAPATLIDKSIQWEQIDPSTVKARFTNAGNTITATLYFNEKGEMIDFVSDDRYQSADGKTYVLCRWSTPVKDYKDFGGMRLASYGEARWHTPDGVQPYIRAHIKEVEYNCKEFRYEQK
jgi:hypothetical protein